jgi:GH15 family glucan-1,4-alpha-glucosidase
VFGALLDDKAGYWSITPTLPFQTQRQYVEDTNVLQTRFQTETGSLLLTDLMPVASEQEKRSLLLPEHEILRFVECEGGELEVEMVFDPRPDYAQKPTQMRNTGKFGLRVETDYGLLVLRTDMPLDLKDGRAYARAGLHAGDVLHFSLTFAVEYPPVLPPLGQWSRDAIARSVTWWRHWTSRLTYDGPGRNAVIRSALVLKLLVYAPSGAVIAAPTTSLPERVGGDLNWDYRYCWLRDASLTVRALFGVGCAEEAESFVSWLLHSTRLTRPELRVLYDVYGNPPKVERVLDHLSGYRSSRPVRINNAAIHQLQLDVYGEVIDAVSHFVQEGGTLDRESQRMLCAFGEYVCRNWQRPDEGIWEPRSGKTHHTHSRVLCWTALDHLLNLYVNGHLRGVPANKFEENRELIRRQVEECAWNPRLESYVSQLDGDTLDASLLLLPWYGFEQASSHRMRRTYAQIQERLGAGEGLLYRYRTGDSQVEGAFVACSFWAAEYLAMGGGTGEEAKEVFQQLLTYGNDVGLLAEEIDPQTKDALGNFPQAFSHVGLINAALSLVRRLEG